MGKSVVWRSDQTTPVPHQRRAVMHQDYMLIYLTRTQDKLTGTQFSLPAWGRH